MNSQPVGISTLLRRSGMSQLPVLAGSTLALGCRCPTSIAAEPPASAMLPLRLTCSTIWPTRMSGPSPTPPAEPPTLYPIPARKYPTLEVR